MIFEEQLGICPSEWLKYAPLDRFLAHNAVPLVPLETQLTEISGLHWTLLRLIIASFFSIFAGIAHRFVPTATGRHIYSFVTGFALLYYPFGNQVVLTLIPCLSVYLAMIAAPKLAGKLSWTISFGWMLLCMERTGDLWDTGAVDIIGSLMVITLKQVAIAHNISDGMSRRAATFSEERKSLLIRSPPSILQYLSFMYAFGNLISGPFNEYTDYETFTERKGAWQQAFLSGMFSSAMAACGKSTLLGLACLAVNRFLEANLSAAKLLTSPRIWKLSLAQRFCIASLTGAAKRTQYYFIWGLSEAALNASGFGFNGFSDPEKEKPVYDRYENADIWQVETCTSIAMVPRYWNVNTGHFLRRYVYDRWGGGVAALAATQMVSGLWHGLREGHLLFFAFTIPMFQASKVMYKQEARLPSGLTKSPAWLVAKWVMAHGPLNIFAQAFILQKWSMFWPTWKAFYFIPHAFVVLWCVVGAVVPTPRSYRSKDSKQSDEQKKSGTNGISAQAGGGATAKTNGDHEHHKDR